MSAIWILVFLGTLVTLVISADFFIKAAERVGLALGIEPFVIGVTLIAIGTSLPELITSIVAVTFEGASSDIVLGNVVGSNITNLCLVMGVVAVASTQIKLEFDLMRVDLPMLIGSAFILLLAVSDNQFSLFEAFVCLAGMALYLTYVFMQGKEDPQNVNLDPSTTEKDEISTDYHFTWKEPVTLLVSAGIIYLSARYNVLAIVEISKIFGIGEGFIALTAVALGTSLPELVVSIVAVRTGNGEMAVGNVLGSNIFNIFAVMGIPRLFGKIEISTSPDIQFSLWTMIAATFVAFFILQDKKLVRWEGWLLLIIYALFIGNLIEIQTS
ncbi:MAG: calcium/sodium antiporter [Bacteroidia bacterium]|nr:calcium/sodium antiporter [Bacteroidia bacterium]